MSEKDLIHKQAGEQLRKLRMDKGESVHKVARAIHISGSYLSEIERGKKEPSDVVLESISEYYNVDKAELFAFYKRIAPEEALILINNPSVRKLITELSLDKRLTASEKEYLYKEIHKIYEKLTDKE